MTDPSWRSPTTSTPPLPTLEWMFVCLRETSGLLRLLDSPPPSYIIPAPQAFVNFNNFTLSTTGAICQVLNRWAITSPCYLWLVSVYYGKGKSRGMGNAQVRILMAEDEAAVSEVMRLALRREGWQVDVVEMGWRRWSGLTEQIQEQHGILPGFEDDRSPSHWTMSFVSLCSRRCASCGSTRPSTRKRTTSGDPLEEMVTRSTSPLKTTGVDSTPPQSTPTEAEVSGLAPSASVVTGSWKSTP